MASMAEPMLVLEKGTQKGFILRTFTSMASMPSANTWGTQEESRRREIGRVGGGREGGEGGREGGREGIWEQGSKGG